MFQYTLINTPSFSVNQEMIQSIFHHVSQEIQITQKGTINIVFVSWDEIQYLNKSYRNKDSPTDVLSFHYFDNYSEVSENDIAWELIFCEEKILSQWKEYGLWEEFEFYKLLIHSLLHILWYDHEIDSEYEIMQSLENKIAFWVFWKILT